MAYLQALDTVVQGPKLGDPPAVDKSAALVPPAPSPSPTPTKKSFGEWWSDVLAKRHAMGMPLDSNPNDPDYNYRALYDSGWSPPANWASPELGEARGHFPDTTPHGAVLKADSNPRAVLHGLDTRTGEQVAPPSYTGPLTAAIKANAHKYKNAGTAHKTRAAGWDVSP